MYSEIFRWAFFLCVQLSEFSDIMWYFLILIVFKLSNIFILTIFFIWDCINMKFKPTTNILIVLLTITRKVLTTISLPLVVCSVKLIVWRPNSKGSILNVIAAEEPAPRVLRWQLLDPVIAAFPKEQIPFPVATVTQNWNVERCEMFCLQDRYTREILKPLNSCTQL